MSMIDAEPTNDIAAKQPFELRIRFEFETAEPIKSRAVS